jgi:hypothetical protein
MITEQDLLFFPIRMGTPQWNVSVGMTTNVVARVTERVVAEPPYRVTFIEDEEEVAEEDFQKRAEVTDAILKRANA